MFAESEEKRNEDKVLDNLLVSVVLFRFSQLLFEKYKTVANPFQAAYATSEQVQSCMNTNDRNGRTIFFICYKVDSRIMLDFAKIAK